ncbi:hypothetical protein EJD88_20355 [Pseudomonas sp. PB105]|uniref:AAA family ATPase n=1 Tax=unclassified Pseudomonas TaxID=196821 RepID=UPI00131C7858|nr:MULTISPECIES: AAA family ATPase [unclassified Pseudomonas]KAE9651045.1 hypothetical protein EJD88_20355 [Pseudomonas sp. PB105]MCM2363468.1 ATP-binding protein [Pseudomonas sp. SR18]MVW98293.1 hypothetical protein [Pseudomonas sp. PB100]
MKNFFVISEIQKQRFNQVALIPNSWDDFSYKTQFYVRYYDNNGKTHDIGNVKIGFKGQTEGWTSDHLEKQFNTLDDSFFSLGQDTDYYLNARNLPKELRKDILEGLRDIVSSSEQLPLILNESVFSTSLLRHTSLSAIHHQYKRILNGGDVLTDFDFSYQQKDTKDISGFSLNFSISPDSKPPTNMHVLIGRNGVGKTTLLNGMVTSVTNNTSSSQTPGEFQDTSVRRARPIDKDYFSSVISVSFSAFDPFTPPADQPDRSKGVRYFYIGLKATDTKISSLKEPKDLCADFIDSFDACFAQERKRRLWENAVEKLNSDINFKEIGLLNLIRYVEEEKFKERLIKVFQRMSSGHAIVLLTLTKLIANIEEKSLILIDEPESHLHPPLLSAFTRTLSDLLIERNGVAIVATHSPVVLQEVPKSCVWKLHRIRLESKAKRPLNETFGENVGTLTSEVFGLEVSTSGFHAMLRQSVEEGKTYKQITEEYGGQLGFEAKSIVRALISANSDSIGDSQ